jgi:hypothetical protein
LAISLVAESVRDNKFTPAVKKVSFFLTQKRAGPKSCRNTRLQGVGTWSTVHNLCSLAVQSQMYRRFAGVMQFDKGSTCRALFGIDETRR